MNPYDPPRTKSAERIESPSNPAKPLLYVVGGLSLFQSIGMVPIAQFGVVDFFVFDVLLFAIGATAIYLGRQRFTKFVRLGTVIWSFSTQFLFLFLLGIEIESSSAQDGDVVGLVYVGLMLLMVTVVGLEA